MLFSCEPEPVEEPPGNPEDYKFAGTWSGNTSQQKIISFTIDTLNKWAQVVNYAIVYRTDSVDLQRIHTNINGISKISDGHFIIDLQNQGNITCVFQNEKTLSGMIHILKNYESSTLLEIPFTAINETDPVNIHAKCMASFEIENELFYYEQDLTYYFPFSDNGLTDSAVFILASMCHNNGILEGQRIITIKKGSFYDTTNILSFFSPGGYPYSVMADSGIEILYYPPDDHYRPWSTSYGAAEQDSGYFRILDTLFIHEYSNETMIKFQAEFSCNLYKRTGERFRLTNGRFIGYARYIRD